MKKAILSLQQISDRINKEFLSDARKLIFWYDDNGTFLSDIENLELKNGKLLILDPKETFKTKVLLEREDLTNNYLIYAPFEKPLEKDNHLADTILYSTLFTADRISMIMGDLGIDDAYRSTMDRYSKFFDAKDRRESFYDIAPDKFKEYSIETTIMSVVLKTKPASFSDVFRTIIIDTVNEESRYFEDLNRYGLLEAFWTLCEIRFGYIYTSEAYNDYASYRSNLIRLSMSLFATYIRKSIGRDLPDRLKEYVLVFSGNVVTYLDRLMATDNYKDDFEKLSNYVYGLIDGKKLLSELSIEDMLYIDLFPSVDDMIITWINNRLIDENITAQIKGLSIEEIISLRLTKYYRKVYKSSYKLLKHALVIISNADFSAKNNFKDILHSYDREDFFIDLSYRYFIFYYDRLIDKFKFENLKELVENIYTSKFLDSLNISFNSDFNYKSLMENNKSQLDFYKEYIQNKKGRKVVIISDALRYEIAKDLAYRMNKDPKLEANVDWQIGIIPSITSLGMAALLPHDSITLSEENTVRVDGELCSTTSHRDLILKKQNENSAGISYSEIIKYKKDDLREFFQGKEIIYIYHDQIDARGDNSSTEDEVFNASNEAINEIIDLIRRLSNNVSVSNVLITSDHGFIYKRSKINEEDKIDRFYSSSSFENRRFVITDEKHKVFGTNCIRLGDIIDDSSDRYVTLPNSSSVFKTTGGGQNYYHGGSSVQELMIPIIEVKISRSQIATEKARIKLITSVDRITNMNFSLEFYQEEPVSDVIKKAEYRVSFVDEDGNTISNEETVVASSQEEKTSDRFYRVRFTLMEKKYSEKEEYYLVIKDGTTGLEDSRIAVNIDMAFSGEYGFDI